MPEDVSIIESSALELQRFIALESEKTGISVSQMVLGGFSMGGSKSIHTAPFLRIAETSAFLLLRTGMALHTGYRFCPGFAGIFALSSFLAQDSLVYQVFSLSILQHQSVMKVQLANPCSV